MKKLILTMSMLLIFLLLYPQDPIRITTWNLEHLGSYGRGLGGIGSGYLGLRTDNQLEDISTFIRDTLKSDIVAIQEVALNDIVYGTKSNEKLDKIVEYLGEDWEYVIGSTGREELIGTQKENMQNAFLWNTTRVNLIKSFDLDIPNILVGKTRAFDRLPFAGYFESLNPNKPDRTDFLLVNVHFKSGQDNNENHLAAMVILEQSISPILKSNSVKESDRVILGDFNDNPYDSRYFDFLYQYMDHKKYKDLTTEAMGATRMDNNLTSIIDHVLVNSSIQIEMKNIEAEKYMPSEDHDKLAAWRKTYSDHFPITFEVKVVKDNDVD